MAAFQIQASSYFTMGVRDTVYLNPACLNAFCNIPVIAHFESRYDSWTMAMTDAADYNCDGIVNINDYTALNARLLGGQ